MCHNSAICASQFIDVCAGAANSTAKAGEMVNTKVQKLAKDVHAIDCSKEVALLLRLSKEAKKAAQVYVCVCQCMCVHAIDCSKEVAL